MKLITILTDFGTKNGYVAQMKGVISSITDAIIIDVSHDISSHNILEGAFVLRNSISYFPTGTVHIAVIDPGVGTDRKCIFITTEKQILIGPDNGLLIPAARLIGNFQVYEITNEKYMLSNFSNTFHGRDVFAPVAAHILNGVKFSDIGKKINDFIDLKFDYAIKKEKEIIGKIVYIDNFGNLITNIDKDNILSVFDFNTKINFLIKNKSITIPFVKSYGFVKKDQLLTTIGSNNFLEISQNNGNASNKLKLKLNDEIKLRIN